MFSEKKSARKIGVNMKTVSVYAFACRLDAHCYKINNKINNNILAFNLQI